MALLWNKPSDGGREQRRYCFSPHPITDLPGLPTSLGHQRHLSSLSCWWDIWTMLTNLQSYLWWQLARHILYELPLWAGLQSLSPFEHGSYSSLLLHSAKHSAQDLIRAWENAGWIKQNLKQKSSTLLRLHRSMTRKCLKIKILLCPSLESTALQGSLWQILL